MNQNAYEKFLMRPNAIRDSIEDALAETLDILEGEIDCGISHHDATTKKHMRTRKSKYKKADWHDNKYLYLFKSSKNGFVKTDDPFIKAYYKHESYRMNSSSAKADIITERNNCREAENDCEYNVHIVPSFSGICKAKMRGNF